MGTTEVFLLLFTISIAGGVLPLLVRDSARVLHLLLCLAAGFFLGVVFLHLLPELAHAGAMREETWGWMLAGLLLVLVLDLGLFGKQSHAAVGWATLIGLTVHAVAMGLSLGVLRGIEVVFLWALLSHKFGEAFSLASALRFTVASKRGVFLLVLLFAVTTPVAMLVGESVQEGLSREFAPILAAVAAGSFLYVAVGDLLPEVFHEAEDRIVKLVLLLSGVGFAAISSGGEHVAAHSTEQVPPEAGGLLEAVLQGGTEFWGFFQDAAPFLLLGFFVAALIRAFLPPRWLAGLLGRSDFGSIVRASAVGAPLPLCSCSVLPTAISLHRRGASKGSTVAFLVSTPETGVDSISVTWALMDPLMTVARPLGAFVSATVAGLAASLVERRGDPREVHAAPGCAGEHDEGDELVDGDAAGVRFKKGVHYAFVDIFDDIMPSMLLGIAIAALFALVLPDNFLAAPWASGFPGLLLAACIGVPIYVCASASTPIAVALMLKGLSPGAALVFLLVGPATNLGSLFALAKVLGSRIVAAYLASVILCAIGLGVLLNLVYGWLDPAPLVRRVVPPQHWSEWIRLACALALVLLCAASLWRRRWLRRLFVAAPV